MTTEAGVLDSLALSYPSSGPYGHIVLLGAYSVSSNTFVAGDISANAINIATNYEVGTRVKITGLSDFDVNTVFFVIQKSPLKFSDTLGGSEIPITTAADGTVTDVEPLLTAETTSTREIQTMADLVRYELTDYLGQNTRPIWTPPVGVIGINQAGERAALLSFSSSFVIIDNADGAPNNPSSLALSFSGFALIKGGSPTVGDTSGTVIRTNSFTSLASVDAGSQLSLQFEVSFPVHDITQNA